MNPPPNDEPPPPGGRLTDELRLLLDALAERAQPWLNRMATGPDGGQHIPATCNWCPLCAALAVLNGQRPELAVRAAEHAAGLIAVLRAALAHPDHPPGWTAAAQRPEDDQTPPNGDSAPEPSARRVQYIEVRRKNPAGEPDC